MDSSIDRAEFFKRAGAAVAAAITPPGLVALNPEAAEAAKRGTGIVRAAKHMLGVPYVSGGETMRGMDCDAFTRKAWWRGAHRRIPVGPHAQWTRGRRRRAKPRAGDVLCWSENRSGTCTHVGIQDHNPHLVLHASSYFGESVRSEKKYIRGFLGAVHF